MNVIKLRKGLDINLKGKAVRQKVRVGKCTEFGLVPDYFVGVTPKMIVHEGDHVKAGDALFVNKNCPEVRFASPVSGMVSAIVRGERRKILCVKINADDEQVYTDYGCKNVSSLDGSEVITALIEAGLFGYINKLPYAVSAVPTTKPKAIFVSAFRDMPLAADFEYELEGNEEDFQTGLTALSKIAKIYLGVGVNQSSEALRNAQNVDINVFDGPCPAGNVGVQINHISPINKGDIVWTVDPTSVIFFGRLFNKGKVDLTHTIAIAGSEINNPAYADVKVGQKLSSILEGKLKNNAHVRIINGNPLVGRKSSTDDYLGAHVSEITAIPEGDDVNEMFGWIMPRINDFSVNHSYFSWLLGKKKEYVLDARIKGGKRNMIMSGEYDKVFPMNIYPEYLIKAILCGDIDKMEALGIYEVSPEDFAMAEFVDSSKLELQQIVRKGLDSLRKEME